MKVVIATTTGFHWRNLYGEFCKCDIDVQYFSYMPRFRLRRDGIPDAKSKSLFFRLLPDSALALFRYAPKIRSGAEARMWEATDDIMARCVPPCDVFIGLSAMAVKCAEVARARHGAKIVIERGSRHVLSQNELVSQDGGKPLSAYYIERELASYDVADYISLPSKHAVRSFLDRGFDRSRLFENPLAVDLAAYQPTPRPEAPTRILFLGGWSHRKGVDILVKAMKRLPGFFLTHVGVRVDVAFPDAAWFTSLGYVNQRVLADVIADHHLLVLPSREDGFGMVLLEALACGLPIVASRTTGGPDIQDIITAKEYVGIVEPGSVDDLVRGLSEMAARAALVPVARNLLTPADRCRLGASGYAARYFDFLTRIVASTR